MNTPYNGPKLLEALTFLNEIGANVNKIGLDGTVSVIATLNLIVKSASRVIPGASASIFTYDIQ
jgi:hypothetical protein